MSITGQYHFDFVLIFDFDLIFPSKEQVKYAQTCAVCMAVELFSLEGCIQVDKYVSNLVQCGCEDVYSPETQWRMGLESVSCRRCVDSD